MVVLTCDSECWTMDMDAWHLPMLHSILTLCEHATRSIHVGRPSSQDR